MSEDPSPMQPQTPHQPPRGAMLMSTFVMVINATMIAFLLTRSFPQENKDILLLVVGQAQGWAGSAVLYWLGSSAGSASKDTRLAALQTAEKDKDKA